MESRMLFGFIPIYGLLISLGIGLGVWLCSRQEERLGLPKDTAVDFALWVIPAAIIGARLYYVAFQWEAYRDDLSRVFRVWEGGMAIYGGVIGGAMAALLYARIKKRPFGALADMTAPALILGQAIVFLLYLCWYGLGRAVIEGLRTDSLMLGSLRVSQVLSLALLIAAGAALLIRRKKRA